MKEKKKDFQTKIFCWNFLFCFYISSYICFRHEGDIKKKKNNKKMFTYYYLYHYYYYYNNTTGMDHDLD